MISFEELQQSIREGLIHAIRDAGWKRLGLIGVGQRWKMFNQKANSNGLLPRKSPSNRETRRTPLSQCVCAVLGVSMEVDAIHAEANMFQLI
ncbi:hypothetical protein TNCV_5061721 [Trichonephila clavipes]|nr:hypothetical protein TNCV_5061721 [Trichonephila clavipes]